jgi:hypothetical protein
MTTRNELDRSISAWLAAEAPNRAPDDVLEASRDRIRSTRQRRAWLPARRNATMSTPLRLAVAAVVVLVIGSIGYQLLPRSGNVGSLPTPTATPTPTSTSTPEPTIVPMRPPSGPIPAGTYRMGAGPTIMVTVPAGWTSVFDGQSIRKHPDQPNELTAVEMWSRNLAVFTDACHSANTEVRIGPTVDDLVSALRAQENSELADPVDVTIAGIDGVKLEVTSPAGLDLSQCTLEGFLQIWQADRGGWGTVSSDGNGSISYVADTPTGRLHLASGGRNAAGTAADNAELDAIWASLEYVK